jgi:hypothetical protein
MHGFSPGERLVLLNLADECRKGTCRVSKEPRTVQGRSRPVGGVELIALEEDLNESTVRRALHEIEKRDVLSVEDPGGGFRGVAVYLLHMYEDPTPPTLFDDKDTELRVRDAPVVEGDTGASRTSTGASRTSTGASRTRYGCITPGDTSLVPVLPVLPPTGESHALERVRGEVVSSSSPPAATGDVETVFGAWAETRAHPNTVKLTGERRKVIARQLKVYPLADLVDAVRGWQNDPFSRGDNDRGVAYNDLALILRDAAHIEKFRDLWRNGAARPRSQTEREIARFLAGEDQP